MKKIILVLCVLLATQATLYAQTKVKWGKLSKNERNIMQFEDDTISSAIVLADVGYVTVSYNQPIAVKRHLRIKITKESGINDYGIFEQSFYAKDRSERISSVKAQVLNVVDGKVAKQKVDKSAIFTEKINEKWSRLKVAFPNVKVGSVIEISYRHNYDSYFSMREWFFQREIPTLYSELRASVNAQIDYQILNFGAKLLKQNTWGAYNLRAIRDEEWCPNEDDFRARLNFQMAGYMSTSGYESTVSTWDELRKDYLKSSSIIMARGKKRKARGFLEELSLTGLPLNEKIQKIKEFVGIKFKWNEFHGTFPDKQAGDFYKLQTGNRAWLNLTYLTMLEEANIIAYPALLGSADNGHVSKTYPMFDNFTDLVVYVQGQNGKWYLSDATDPFLPFDLLPTSLLNDEAYVLFQKKGEWVGIKRPDFRTLWSENMIRVDSTNIASITSKITFKGYLAAHVRKQIAANEEKEAIQKLIAKNLNFKVADFSIKNKEDVHKPLIVKLNFTSPIDFSTPVVSFNPFVIRSLDNIELKDETRFLPLDFEYAREQITSVTLILPTSIAVESIPTSQVLTLKDKTAFVEFKALKINPATVQFSSRLKLVNALYPPQEYANLKRLFDLNGAKQKDGIVLKLHEGK